MKNLTIRTITGGFNYENYTGKEYADNVINLFSYALETFDKSDIKVRTTRLNLPVFGQNTAIDNKKIFSLIDNLNTICLKNEIRWICAPFDTFDNDLKRLNSEVIEIIKRFNNVFINYLVVKKNKINRNGLRYSAKLIKSISNLSNTGYDNFRFGASFNCVPNTPFFPFTYQEGDDGFSISMELIEPINNIVNSNKTTDLNIIREEIINKISPELIKINDLCLSIANRTNKRFYGIDISLAPYPDSDKNSMGRLIESFGIDSFGSPGTLFFTGFLTNILKSLIHESQIKSTGFNGVMYSLLEDTGLGKNSSTKEFSIDSLISYSTVCGCGIDMVPVPGDCFEEELSSLMLDIATLSILLDKPLGVRILPIPMKRVNEFTEFSHDFLTNSRIQDLKNKMCSSDHFDSSNPFSFKNY